MEQFLKLRQIDIRIDSIRKLLDVAHFGGCECYIGVRGAHLLATEAAEQANSLFSELYGEFSDQFGEEPEIWGMQ